MRRFTARHKLPGQVFLSYTTVLSRTEAALRNAFSWNGHVLRRRPAVSTFGKLSREMLAIRECVPDWAGGGSPVSLRLRLLLVLAVDVSCPASIHILYSTPNNPNAYPRKAMHSAGSESSLHNSTTPNPVPASDVVLEKLCKKGSTVTRASQFVNELNARFDGSLPEGVTALCAFIASEQYVALA